MFAYVLLCNLLDFCFTFCSSKIESKFLALIIFDFNRFITKNLQCGLISNEKLGKLLANKLSQLQDIKSACLRNSNDENEKQLVGVLKLLRALIHQIYLK